MDRGNKHSPMRDDALSGDVEGMLRSGHSTHAEEFKDPEPPADDEPSVDRSPDGSMSGGAPEGMSSAEVTERSELAEWLRRSAFPNDRQGLLDAAREANAPDRVIGELERVPAGEEFSSVGELWRALGHPAEDHRF